MGTAPVTKVRKAVEFDAAPPTQLWVIVCLCTACGALGLTLFLGLGELIAATQTLLLEALVMPPRN